MELSTQQQIENIKKNGYDLDFSIVFTKAIENFKKIALYAGLILLVFSIMGVFIATGFFFAIYGAAALNESFIQELAQIKLTGFALLSSLVIQIFISALFSPMIAGFYKMADCAENNETFTFLMMFRYYKTRYFTPIFIASVLITSFSLVIVTLSNQLGVEIIGIGFNLIISFFTYLTIPLIIFGKLNATNAIKVSYIILSKQPIVILGLIITGLLVSMIGFIGCCIGVFFTIPFNYSITYSIYTGIIRKDLIDPIDSIGTENEN